MNYLFNGVSLQNGRQSNMDSLLLKSGYISKERALLAVVCDGVGSLADGAFASGEAARRLSEWFGKVMSTDRIGLRMRDTILGINSHIVSQAKYKNIKTASTLSVLLITGNSYYIVHVGDSRIYSYENETLSILTNDDTSESGKLTVCIGQTENIVPQYYEGTAAGKTFLLCTDGLYKRMDTNFMTTKMKIENKRTLNESLEDLTQYVIKCGEQDNISLALVKIES